MQTREVSGLNYLLPSNPCPYPPNNYTMIQNNNIPTFQFPRFSNQLLYGYNNNNHNQNQNPIHDFSPQSSCISSNSTSDEADEQQLSLINERKHRRMISNRESARRSRMRKQKHLDELWSQVVWLRNENHQLIDKLNHVSESHDQVVQENAQLKEQASELRQMIRDMQIHSPCPSFTPLEDDAYLRSADSSNHSNSSNMDLLG
ncbi:basic leucine zipper 43 [Cajanus cajan]|uniref:Ocs element-binding factor 1 n=1 Tax=Cajanus cajan TaxID=3821 RepID=A0A151S027_CAJCA|nr:basic leucine zipper 43 [Cajanus cajan]KYP48087.1 Ocs element-binding factor 1 [Cajanus cajan]